MAELNKTICVEGGNNTGFGDCVLDIQNVKGAIIVPRDFELDAAGLADLEATLRAQVMSGSPSTRIYPVHNFEQITSATEEKTIQTLGYGGKAVVREGDYDWTFQFFQGGLCLLKNLRAFNRSNKAAFFYDANGVLFGWKVGDTLKGVPLKILWANPWTPNDGTNASIYTIQFVFEPKYINDEIGFVYTDFPIDSIEGLQDVVLAEAPDSARPVLEITAKTSCGGDDMAELYGAEIADPLAWTATINGAPVAISSVAESTTNSGWTVTVDVADPNYDAGEPLVISWVGPIALDALGVTGYESKKLTIPGA